jgi:hypothetical protein
VTEFASPALSAWQSFYVIVGSSGAALIGVQFIVITLIAAVRQRPTPESISAFATPTVVHLAGALLVSAIMSVPWRSFFLTSVALALCGLGGLAYGAMVLQRARHQTFYQPVWEDWLWYGLLPCSVYTALALAAVFLGRTTQFAEFVIGAAALGLLLIGIHNAWDSVTHIIVAGSGDDSTMRSARYEP